MCRIINMKKMCACIVISALWMFSLAESRADNTYQYAVGGLYSSENSDNDIDITRLGAGLRYYLAPVSTDKGPLKLADFLSRQSNATVFLSNVDVDLGFISPSGTLIDLGYQNADPSQAYTFGIAYQTGEAKESSFKISIDAIEVTLGYYLDATSRVLGLLAHTDVSYGSGIPDYKTDTVGLNYRQVMRQADLQYIDLQLGAVLIENDDNDTNLEFSVSGDYFVNLGMDFFGGLALNTGDDSSQEGTTLNIGVSTFFNPTTSISFELTEFMADKNGYDSDAVLISFETRM